MKIAVSTTDGKNIDTHFGKADSFYVFEFNDEKLKLVEKRETEKYCSENPKHAFQKDKFEKVYNMIQDCEVLYTVQIGDVPAEKLRSLGMQVYQVKGKIAKVIEG